MSLTCYDSFYVFDVSIIASIDAGLPGRFLNVLACPFDITAESTDCAATRTDECDGCRGATQEDDGFQMDFHGIVLLLGDGIWCDKGYWASIFAFSASASASAFFFSASSCAWMESLFASMRA